MASSAFYLIGKIVDGDLTINSTMQLTKEQAKETVDRLNIMSKANEWGSHFVSLEVNIADLG